jgi:uncharacterized protein (TIGR03086 family)
VSENLRNYTTIVFGFEHVLRQVPDDAWGRQSPCDEWTARHVAGHVIGVLNNVTARAGLGRQVDVFADLERIAGTDPLAAFRAVRRRYLDATDRQGALQRPVTSRLGNMTLDRFLGQMCIDTLVHTWDLARATGVDERLDPDSVELVLAEVLGRDSDLVRGPERYADALEAGDGYDAQQRLIAFTGRTP